MIAGLVAGSFQPQPRASATEATFREIAGLDLPEATEVDIAQGFMDLAPLYEEDYPSPGPLASRGATVREIADLLKADLLKEKNKFINLGNLRNAEKVWRAVAAHYAQLPDGRSQAIAATWLREADKLWVIADLDEAHQKRYDFHIAVPLVAAVEDLRHCESVRNLEDFGVFLASALNHIADATNKIVQLQEKIVQLQESISAKARS